MRFCEVDHEASSFIKVVEFLEPVSDYQLLKRTLLVELQQHYISYSSDQSQLLQCILLLLLLLLLLSGPRAYAPDALQPCRLIVLPSYYSSVLDVPTFRY